MVWCILVCIMTLPESPSSEFSSTLFLFNNFWFGTDRIQLKITMKKIRVLMLMFAILITTISCKKEEGETKIGEVTFSLVSSTETKGSVSIDDAVTIVLTIVDNNGEATNYTSTELEIYKMNDCYYSQKISLEVGDYFLNQFILEDSGGNTIYAAPVTGSLEAKNVENPLPLSFSVKEDEITSVYLEVVSCEGLSPSDFGLSGIFFTEVKMFGFLVNVSELRQFEYLLTATITVTSNGYSHVQELKAIANNVVIIKDDYEDYTVTIEREGYVSYSKTFLNDELKNYAESPLTVELVKGGLLCYYPFNGNANDNTGNGKNGMVNGATLCTDRFGNENSAYYFDGIDDYIQLDGSLLITNNFTISFWAYSERTTGYSNILCDGSSSYGGNDFLINFRGNSIGIRADKNRLSLNYEYSSPPELSDLDIVYKWVHVVWAMNSTTSKIYLNGDLIATIDIAGTNEGYHDTYSYFGARHVWGRPDNFFMGKLDDIKIYNEELSSDEIRSLYNENDYTP